MSDLQFDEDQEVSRPVTVSRQSVFIRLSLATGVVNTEEGANYLLLGLSIVVLIVAGLIASSGVGKPPHNPYKEGQSTLVLLEAPVRTP